jgi:hypothetical protein
MDGFASLVVGFGCLAVVFFLVIILGLQIQISGIAKRLDEVLNKLNKE